MREHLALAICLQLMGEYEELVEAYKDELDDGSKLTSQTLSKIKPANTPHTTLNEVHNGILNQFKNHYNHLQEFNYGS